jgi:hypothetical protein
MLARGAGRRRSTRLYTEAVDSALTAHLPFIKALFRGHSGRNQTREDVKKMCSLGEWMDLMAKARPRKQRARATRLGVPWLACPRWLGFDTVTVCAGHRPSSFHGDSLSRKRPCRLYLQA